MPPTSNRPYTLSKHTFVAGTRCHKLLWWMLNEPDAPELNATQAGRARMEMGTQVGIVAREYVPGGLLIEGGGVGRSLDQVLLDTDRAITGNVPVIYEGAFIAKGTLVFADILVRNGADRFTLIEVKSASSLNETHVVDAAFQAHILRAAGVDVTRVEIMHLNRECRYPDLEDLFVREDVSEQAFNLNGWIEQELERQQGVAKQSLCPSIVTGDHCSKPSPCSFHDRCWPELPEHHVSTLYYIKKAKVKEYEDAGYRTIHDLPDSLKLSAIAARQRRAVREGRTVVEHGNLIKALQTLVPPVAHIDFETVQLPIPRWNGCRPYDMVPVQMSCHVVHTDVDVRHYKWLAEDSSDPRYKIAEAVIRACEGANTITAYYAPFEQARLKEMAEHCVELAGELIRIADSITDLLPIVRNHVYHPEFYGSFSIKSVLPALVPDLSHSKLNIKEGETASAELMRMLFGSPMPEEERELLRNDLLAYCELDTKAMVALTEQLTRLASTDTIAG